MEFHRLHRISSILNHLRCDLSKSFSYVHHIFKHSLFSSLFPPVLNPQRNPFQSNTMTDDFLRTHPHFKTNVPSLYMTPTTFELRFPKNRNFDQYVAYASKNLE